MNQHVQVLLVKELDIRRTSNGKYKAYDLLSEYAEGLLRTELEALAALYFSLDQHSNLVNGQFIEIKKEINEMERELKNKYL